MRAKKKDEFVPAMPHDRLTSEEVIRRLSDSKGCTQEELAKRSGISPTNLSLLENNRVEIGKKRAEQLAKAFSVHPAIIMFPEYAAEAIETAA